MITGHSGSHSMFVNPSQCKQSLKQLRDKHAATRQWRSAPWVVDGVLVYVDDGDPHFAQAAGGATLTEPEDGLPAGRYWAEDLEGPRWMFRQQTQGPSQRSCVCTCSETGSTIFF